MKDMKHWVIAHHQDVIAVQKAVTDTLRARHPGMPDNQLFDYLLFSTATLGAALAAQEPDPMAMANQIGQALTENMKRLLKQ